MGIDEPDPLPRRRLRCQCDGATVGPCPGPLNCPYSGLGPEQPEGEQNMARHDISYDFEDFGKDQLHLEEKYGAAGHPEYTLEQWRDEQSLHPDVASQYNGYYDWVAGQIAKDDEDIPGAAEDAK